MPETRSRSRPTQGKVTAVKTALNARHLQEEADSAVSPGNVKPRPVKISVAPQRSQRLPVNTMPPTRRRSPELPAPVMREFSSDDETVDNDHHDDVRVALPPANRTFQSGNQPLKFSTTQSAAIECAASAALGNDARYRELASVDRKSVERASFTLAQKLLAEEHDREINKLGTKIYKSSMKVKNPTIGDAFFDSDSEDSDYSETSSLDLPLSPGLIRMQRWLDTSSQLRSVLFICLLLIGYFVYAEERAYTRWMLLIMVIVLVLMFTTYALAEREKGDRSNFGKLLRSGLFYIRGQPARPAFRALSGHNRAS